MSVRPFRGSAASMPSRHVISVKPPFVRPSHQSAAELRQKGRRSFPERASRTAIPANSSKSRSTNGHAQNKPATTGASAKSELSITNSLQTSVHGGGSADRLQIREAIPAEYWAISDMHCMAFYPREPPGAVHELMRLDRVLAVCMEKVRSGGGGLNKQFICLVACASNGAIHFPTSEEAWQGRPNKIGSQSSTKADSDAHSALPHQPARNSSNQMLRKGYRSEPNADQSSSPVALDSRDKLYQQVEDSQSCDAKLGGPLQAIRTAADEVLQAVQQWQRLCTWAYWLTWRSSVPGSVTAGLGVDVDAVAVLGAVVIDTFGEHLPPRRLPNGKTQKRPKLAYCSNLAVAEVARRRKVAARLLDEAEAVAIGWGCTAMALHVGNDNTEATALYRGRGYRPLIARRTSWASRVAISDKTLMLKRLCSG